MSFQKFAIVLCIAVCMYPVYGQNTCQFNGPSDGATLQGVNYIENFGTGNCMKLQRFGANYKIPIALDSCTWNSRKGSEDQLFQVKNGNGGSILRPKIDDKCFAIDSGKLVSTFCTPKSNDQTWIVQNVKANKYQIIQKSTGSCLKANSRGLNSAVKLATCKSADDLQLWRICTNTGY